MMLNCKKLAAVAGAAIVTAMAATASARADEARAFTYSFNIGAYSDYMFRGLSQSDDRPVLQGGADIGYGIFYAGVWLSKTEENFNAAPLETDFYAGVKPVLGPVTFDFGVLYYGYPSQDGAISLGLDVDYYEFKAAASYSPITNLTTTVLFYYTPDYSFETGRGTTIEGNIAYTLPQFWVFTPTISATLGYFDVEKQWSTEVDGSPVFDVTYWNAGLALAVEKITIDLRYYGSNIDVNIPNTTSSDDRFVAGVKIALP